MSIIMPAMRYHLPATLADALKIKRADGEASYLSGGHTLLPAIKSGLAAPTALIDLRAIPEMKPDIVAADGRIQISAATPHADVAASAAIKGALPVLAALAGSIGDVQVRNSGTIGGSIANCDPAADYQAAVLALSATITTDRRSIIADDFFKGLYTTCLEEDEIVTRVAFPYAAECGYAKFRNPASRYAMAAVFVAKLADHSVRCAVTGAGNDGVFRWTEAENALRASFTPDVLEELRPEETDMMDDVHGTADYRAHLVSVMARRAIANMGTAVIFG